MSLWKLEWTWTCFDFRMPSGHALRLALSCLLRMDFSRTFWMSLLNASSNGLELLPSNGLPMYLSNGPSECFFEWSWVEQKHSGRISSLGTEKARIWPLTQELNPQSAFNYFYICKGNMPFSHVQCTWTCFLSALLMASFEWPGRSSSNGPCPNINRRVFIETPIERLC